MCNITLRDCSSHSLYLQPLSPLLPKNNTWFTFGIGHSLEQLPSKRRERLPTEPGTGTVPTPTWDSTASVMSYTAGVGVGGYSTPLMSSPIKSPPSNSHSETDDLDPAHRGTTKTHNSG